MTSLFQIYNKNQCCLCGNVSKLTGEHKIKASSLRKEFGKTELHIYQNQAHQNSRESKLRYAQSDKSKFLKFKTAKLCEICNTSLTQPADFEFDAFNTLVKKNSKKGWESSEVFKLPEYAKETESYLNIFRYFAKLLCCHLSDIDAPVPRRLSSFSINKDNFNQQIWLEIKNDPIYENLSEQIKDLQYAAHGGLTVFVDKLTYIPRKISSSLTIGSIQYIFHVELSAPEQQELETNHTEFFELCKSQAEKES